MHVVYNKNNSKTPMRRHLMLGILVFLSVRPALGQPEWDDRYAFEKLSLTVILTRAEPLYQEAVELGARTFLEKDARFQLVETKELVESTFLEKAPPSLGKKGTEEIGPYKPFFERLVGFGVQGALLGEVQQEVDGTYFVLLVLVVPQSGEVVHSVRQKVEDPSRLSHFSETAGFAMEALLKGIPFEGTIVSREGYRIVLNTGFPHVHSGERLPVYTLDKVGEGYVFRETGMILITHVERFLAFGTVLVEKEGVQVTRGNKVRLSGGDEYAGRFPLAKVLSKKTLPSLITADTAFEKGQIGTFQLDFGASFVTLALRAAPGGSNSQQVTYPTSGLKGELWVTPRVFFQLGFGLSTATLSSGAERLNSNLSTFRTYVGYRVLLTQRAQGATLHGGLGYASYRLVLDPSSDPLFFGASTFQGVSLGFGTSLPLTDRWGVGADVHVLPIPGLDEGPLTSGIPRQLSAVDFEVRAFYNLSSELDLEAKFILQSFAANFSGSGTRPIPLVSSSRSSRALSVGLAYYF